ncbi:MAG TPA: OmpA family protein, partial [Gemmatimonadales bacterium]|nr:OmpA family protein [Gemmatimonadales bacterium]
NVEVIGHTDWIGTNEYNMRLSRARAESVKNFLIARGVAADRVATAWFGEERPVATNETDAGRAQNRRVEINRTNENEDR